MFKLLGKKINLGYALGLSEVEFKNYFGSVFKDKINEAWIEIKRQQDAIINKSVEENADVKPVSSSKQKRNKGVHPETESTESNLD